MNAIPKMEQTASSQIATAMSPPKGLSDAKLLAYAAVYLGWGTTYLAIRVGIRDIGPASFLSLRFLIAAVVLLPIVLVRGGHRSLTMRQIGHSSLQGLLLLIGGLLPIAYAEKTLSSSVVAMVIGCAPIGFAVFDRLLNKTPIYRKTFFKSFAEDREPASKSAVQNDGTIARPMVSAPVRNDQNSWMEVGYVRLKFLHLLLAVALFASVKALAKSSDRLVTIGLAGNFSQTSDSTSHPYGQHLLNAASMAVEDYRSALHKKGITINLVKFDYGASTDLIHETAQNAVKSDAIAVLGFIYSSHVLIAAETFSKGGLPLLTPTATADKIDDLGPYLHRSCFSDSLQGALLAKGAKVRGIKRVAIVAAVDCAYCQSLKTSFLAEFIKNGGVVAADV